MTSPSQRYYAAACQFDLLNPKPRDEIPARVQKMLTMISCAVTGYEPFHDVRLVAFPEFAADDALLSVAMNQRSMAGARASLR